MRGIHIKDKRREQQARRSRCRRRQGRPGSWAPGVFRCGPSVVVWVVVSGGAAEVMRGRPCAFCSVPLGTEY